MARRDNPRFHGFLIVDKPAGMTSHDVVGRIRRLTRQRTVGHAGTLDPAATGVLPLALGEATKTLSWMEDSAKTYRAEITFGIETDTLDADGRLTATASVDIELDQVQEALTRFTGPQLQVAPRYSAIQRDGKRLYDLARAGVDFEPPSREVEIQQIELLDFASPVLTICVDCSAGTYIRSLAHDLGQELGCGAHLSDLVRLRAGDFSLDDAWTLDQLAEMPIEETWPVIAYHADTVLGGLPVVILDDASVRRWELGQTTAIDHQPRPSNVRVYSTSGDWIGIGEVLPSDGAYVIQPRRVIGREAPEQEPMREAAT